MAKYICYGVTRTADWQSADFLLLLGRANVCGHTVFINYCREPPIYIVRHRAPLSKMPRYKGTRKPLWGKERMRNIDPGPQNRGPF
jgi:hypothetical protein